jgi:hypothetical protein
MMARRSRVPTACTHHQAHSRLARAAEASVTLSLRKKTMLLGAMLESYPDEVITGYLVDAFITCNVVTGHAYKASGYSNGERLISGEIAEALRDGHRWLIKTRDHKTFVIVNFHVCGGRRSLLHMIDLFESARLLSSRWCLQ